MNKKNEYTDFTTRRSANLSARPGIISSIEKFISDNKELLTPKAIRETAVKKLAVGLGLLSQKTGELFKKEEINNIVTYLMYKNMGAIDYTPYELPTGTHLTFKGGKRSLRKTLKNKKPFF